MEFLIRSQHPDELAAVLALVGDAFADEPVVVDLVRDLAADPAFDPELSLVAESDGALVGHVLLTPATIEGGATPVEVLSLAPLGVVQGSQRQGVGTALVRAALELAKERETTAVIVLGDPAYYGRFGFGPALPLGILPPHPVSMAAAWMVAETVPGALTGRGGTVRFLDPLQDPKYW